MPLISCPNSIKECLPCDDDPIRNLSAEDPDFDRLIGVHNFRLTNVPLNYRFRQTACKTLCYSEVSQAEADDCARRTAQECVFDDMELPDGTPMPVFYNSAQSYTVRCPDGSEFTWTIAAREVIALSQFNANQLAFGLAKRRAEQNRVCILTSLLTGGCNGSSYSGTIQAVGGTALYFPYIRGPQTPFGFAGCGSNFQPQNYIWAVVGGSLPPGLELDDCTGVITGTPTAIGVYTFTVRVTDAIGSYQQKTLQICIVEIATASPLPDATEGSAYSQGLAQNGGVPETAIWSVVFGSLPAGMTLSADGLLSGTPEETGDFSFRIRLDVGICS